MSLAGRQVVIVGGGFSGSALALTLIAVAPDAPPPIIVERSRRVGPGLAYGACGPEHLLNVPVSRLEAGLTPGFQSWLLDKIDPTIPADAFVPRAWFGRYLEERVTEATYRGLRIVRGDAVRIAEAPRRVMVSDGRVFQADVVVLALGNLPPGRDALDVAGVGDHPALIVDPWAQDEPDPVDSDATVVFLGSGLTLVDQAISLSRAGHRGPMLVVSRHGLPPQPHTAGGAWSPFLHARDVETASAAMRALATEVRAAAAAGVPWQRVLDAARPDAARVWRQWSQTERLRFLRRLRRLWDVHRHRMPPATAEEFGKLQASGQLRFVAGRLANWRPCPEGLSLTIKPKGRVDAITVTAARLVNCTGPMTDLRRLEAPLLADLRQRGLAAPDPLGLGLSTRDCHLVDIAGAASDWLYAIGPLTRGDLWEVTAVPEIAAQVQDLAARLAAAEPSAGNLADRFADLGAFI